MSARPEGAWLCDGCGKPVTSDRPGVLLFTDPETGGRCRWTQDRERIEQESFAAEHNVWDQRHTNAGGLVYSLAEAMTKPDFPARCCISVYHPCCDPNPDSNVYQLPAEKQHGTELLDTVAHLLGRTWFGAEEARQLIYRYLDGTRRKREGA